MPSHDLALSPHMRASVMHVGHEREPVMQVDGVMRNAQALVDYAAHVVTFAPAHGPAGGYPGVRAPAPLDYVELLARALQPAIIDAFELGRVKLARAECNFSLATLAPDQLVAAQREPHVDTVDPLQFAILHYLCEARFGGTAFYRHRATAFETLTAERLAAYEATRSTERTTIGYPDRDHPHFEETALVEAQYDRLIVYRSRLLHSGRIDAPELLSADPRRGRLTANIFLSFRPA